MTTVRELLAGGVERFERAELSYGHGTTNASDEAAWLVLHALGLPPSDLEPHLERRVTAAEARKVRALLERRVRTRKPAAYLINEAWLGPHRFYVDERVIVPRSYIFELLENGVRLDFEPVPFLVEHQRKKGTGSKSNLTPFSILDLCTGSGCLAILAALAFPGARVDAADISRDALDVARRNVADYRLGKRIRLVQSDLFSALAGRAYDLILTNPPYVKAASMRTLPEEYRKEPRLALASGADGLEHARAILAGARAHLAPGGLLVMEIGHNRRALERAFPDTPFHWPKTSGGRGFVLTLERGELPFRRNPAG